jgi:hypothetical protein
MSCALHPTRGARSALVGLLLSVSALAALGAACVSPPALLPVPGGVDAAGALASMPPGTESVELEVEPGVHLRGFFVPARDGAPVVLHLRLVQAIETAGGTRALVESDHYSLAFMTQGLFLEERELLAARAAALCAEDVQEGLRLLALARRRLPRPLSPDDAEFELARAHFDLGTPTGRIDLQLVESLGLLFGLLEHGRSNRAFHTA